MERDLRAQAGDEGNDRLELVEVGQALETRYVVQGRLDKFGKEFLLTASIADARTGEGIARVREPAPEEIDFPWAADRVGANALLCRVGAYYHDIGKIKRPYFFVENQTDPENPHDKIAPTLSTLIITSHVKDGLDLCREHKLPQVIADMIQQHHGTSLVSYFYKRATENEHSECIVEEDFRYEGPRPQTKEVALVMLADVCEAAVRSLAKPNVNRIEATVRKMIRETP